MSKKTFIATQFISVIIFAFLTLSHILPVTFAQNTNLTYQGEGKPLDNEYPPVFEFKLENGTTMYFYNNETIFLYPNQTLNLNLTAFAGKSPDGRAVGVLQVSYKASWLEYPVVMYHWNGNPADFEVWYTNGPAYTFDYSLVLSNIPEGHQQTEFTVTAIGMYTGVPYFSSFTKENNATLDFAVFNTASPSPSPTPTPSPTQQPTITPSQTPDRPQVGDLAPVIIPASMIFLAILVVGLLFYFRKRKG